MIQSYLKIALRQILKNKFYAIINISGLAFGLTASLFMGLYVHDELTYDQFHTNYADIYQVGYHVNFGGQDFKSGKSSVPMGMALMNTVPGVDQATRLFRKENLVMRNGDKVFTESNAFLADSNFFDFFSFELVEGSPKTVLKEPHTVVLTDALARKYFGDEPAVGKTLVIGEEDEAYTVTGIATPAPANSSIQYDVLLSSASSAMMTKGDWGYAGIYTFFRKNPETPLAAVESALKTIVQEHIAPMMAIALGLSSEDFINKNVFTLFSIPLSSLHLYQTDIHDGPTPASNSSYVYIVGAVGIFILLIACINFMNLSTARSAGRAKEVGLRKTLGSHRSKLIAQFMMESFVYVFAATVIAIAGLYLLNPYFNLLSGKTLAFNTLLSPTLLLSIAVIFVVVALLAGSYPAFYLTAYKPAEVLKGNVRAGLRSKGIRSSLVVVQFVISITLIICTLVVKDQLTFMQERNTGLDKENVLILKNTKRLGSTQQAFMDALDQQPIIEKASYTNNVFPGINNTGIFHTPGKSNDFLLADYYADYNHLDVLQLHLLEGRYFSKAFPTDSLACVINEAAAKELGWSKPLNEKLTNLQHEDALTELHVIGIVKDFNFESFKYKVKPVVIKLREFSNNILIRYTGESKVAIATVESIWKTHAANEPFEYTFLDQNFDSLFREEQRMGQLFTAMSSIAIFIACLGLLGLAAFTAEQRTKEIGIRKVMGASIASVNALLSKEFMMLVGLSFVIGSAIAWYAMSSWLDTFAYRIQLGAELFILAGGMAALIAWITVSYHFIKAALSNPVDALRSE